MEIFTTEGKVKCMKKDRKGFQLEDGMWYSGFDVLTAKKGDNVKVGYKINGNFRNISSLDVLNGESNPSNGEFHLSIEQVRTNALNAAIKINRSMNADELPDFWALVGECEAYISGDTPATNQAVQPANDQSS